VPSAESRRETADVSRADEETSELKASYQNCRFMLCRVWRLCNVLVSRIDRYRPFYLLIAVNVRLFCFLLSQEVLFCEYAKEIRNKRYSKVQHVLVKYVRRYAIEFALSFKKEKLEKA